MKIEITGDEMREAIGKYVLAHITGPWEVSGMLVSVDGVKCEDGTPEEWATTNVVVSVDLKKVEKPNE